MDFWYSLLLGFLLFIVCSDTRSYGEVEIARSLDISGHWKPLSVQGIHTQTQSLHSPISPHFISVANIDTANQYQISQIARHNAQILQHIKGFNPPVTQYRNPFPINQQALPYSIPHQNFVNTPNPHHHHNLLTSSSNIAQTVLPNSFIKQTFITGKPTFVGKQEFGRTQFYNGIHSSTAKIPTIVKTLPVVKHTTKTQYTTNHHLRDPILYRDVTLTAPPQPSSGISRPHGPVVQQQLPYEHKTNLFAYPAETYSSYAFFGPSAHLVREKSKLKSSAVNSPHKSHINFGSAPGFMSNPTGSHNFNSNSFQHGSNDLQHHIRTSITFPPSDRFTAILSTTRIPENSQPTPSKVIKYGQNPLPPVPASVLTPFYSHIQAPQQNQNIINKANAFKEEGSRIRDDYTKNLVPPPPVRLESSTYRPTKNPSIPTVSTMSPHEQLKAIDILNKYNIPAISPLQDANKFKYNKMESHHVSTTPLPFTSSSITNSFFGSQNLNTFITTEKPDIFKHLKRPIDNTYKEHKLMHPSYTGAKFPNDVRPSVSSGFLPTPYNYNDSVYNPEHSFFTIEDAITVAPPSSYRTSTAFPSPTPSSTQSPSPPPVKTEPTTTFRTTIPAAETTTQIPYIPIRNVQIIENSHAQTSPQPQPQPPSPQPSRMRTRNKMRRRRPRPTTGKQNLLTEDNQIPPSEFSHPQRRPTPSREKQIRTTTERNVPVRTKVVRRPIPTHDVQTTQTTTGAWSQSPSTTASARPTLSKHNGMEILTTKTYHGSRFNNILTTANADVQQTENHFPDLSIKQTTKESFPETTFMPTKILSRTRQPLTTTPLPSTEESYKPSNLNHFRNTAYPNNAIAPHSDINVRNENDLANVPPTEATINKPIDIAPSQEFIETEPITTPITVTEKRIRQQMQIRNRQRLRHKTRIPDVSTATGNQFEESGTSKETASKSTESTESEIITPKLKTTENPIMSTHLKPIGQYDPKTRPRFSVKDYRQRLRPSSSSSASTSTSTERGNAEPTTAPGYSRIRFPTRKRLLPNLQTSITSTTSQSAVESIEHNFPSNDDTSDIVNQSDVEITEANRPQFDQKLNRNYLSRTSSTEIPSSTPQYPRKSYSTRRDYAHRTRYSTSTSTSTTPPPAIPTVSVRTTNITLRRPQTVSLRQRIQNFQNKNKVEDIETVNEVEENIENDNDKNTLDDLVNITMDINASVDPVTESVKVESAIMKIAKDDHSYRPQIQPTSTESVPSKEITTDLKESPSEYSERVAQLTVSGNAENFKTINTNMLSRRIPGYFTVVATEDPILPIEAFFPSVNKHKSLQAER